MLELDACRAGGQRHEFDVHLRHEIRVELELRIELPRQDQTLGRFPRDHVTPLALCSVLAALVPAAVDFGLDDGFDASPALVDNEIYMRGFRYLYAIAQ